MDNSILPEDRTGDPQQQDLVPAESTVYYPPKFIKPEQRGNVWIKSIVSLMLYLILGYYIFPSYKMLLIITAIVVIHELGHFLAMKYYKYSELGIFFIPLLGAYVSGTKREVSQKQSAVILLAGPLPGIVLGIVFFLIDNEGSGYYPFNVSLSTIGSLFVVLNLINLLPIYPLDGGQLLNRIFLDEDGIMSKIFVFVSAALMCLLAWKLDLIVLYIFPVMMLLRLRGDTQFNSVDKRIEREDINADASYEELKDEDYWKIRTVLIEEHPSFRDVPTGPPYEYSPKEEKIMSTIQSLLHRHLIQDMSLLGKIFILVLCILAFTAPWLLEMEIPFFNQFGF
jgi:Zn-dependent protease